MKNWMIYLGVAVFLTAAVLWAQTSGHAPKQSQIMGSWELVSGATGTETYPGPQQKQIKMISKNHYMWVMYDTGKMKTLSAGAGTYKLAGDAYTEHLDFFDVEGGASYVGKDLTFKVTIEGDTLTQTGKIGSSELKETWKRVD